MAFLNLEKVGRDFTLSGKEFHNFIVEGKKDLDLFEDAIHFFLECPLYQHDRTSMFNYFNNIVPISIEYILFGCNVISEH
jgi:hypothetical protein